MGLIEVSKIYKGGELMIIVLAITGASGAIYGIRLLEILSQYKNIKTHLILTSWARKTIEIETDYNVSFIKELADTIYDENELCASISSGSFRHDGMVIAPCSMKTLAGISQGYDDNLVTRAASVAIKENRKLVLLPRETPLTAIHLENMLKLSKIGAVIMPPLPAFYHKPQSINDIVDHTVSRVLDQLGIENDLIKRWE
ncbi:putative UbiX-like flavin prenyltransferase [Natranaerofaba carboxydovora]|nr:putative UbiX-like flavin prenyltransferase [Natranaerofaba carboxydovora]